MELLFYTLLILGIVLMFSSGIQYLLRQILKGANSVRPKGSEIKAFEPVRSLLQASMGDEAAAMTEVIVLCIGLLSAVVFFTVQKELNLKLALMAVGMTAGLPFIVLRLRLYHIRIESSYEGEFLITELINQYKLNHFNMVEAIDATVVHLKDSPKTRRLLFSMSLKLKSYRSREELETILSDFTYAVNTQWSMMLANNLILAIEEGFEVTSGLVDIQNELKQAKSAYEKSSRNTVEGFAIVKVLIPLLYVFTIFMSVKYFNFTIEKFVMYQIFTPSGMKMLILNGLLYTFNVIVMVAFKKRKFDIA